jgi:hypothetical protein
MNFENHAVISFVEVAPVAAKNFRPQMSDMEQQVASWSDELHFIVGAAKQLRSEAEAFVNWCRVMGEGINPQTWTTIQQTYATEWRERHRAMAAAWKVAVANYYKDRAAEAVEYFFGDECKGRYDVGTTASARRELGI